MKNLSVVLLCFLGMVSTILAAEKGIPYGCVTPESHTDSLYRIADRKLGDPILWKKLYEKNPQLHAPGKLTTDSEGRTYVWLKDNEIICGLDELGLIPKLATPEQMVALGFKTQPINAISLESPKQWLTRIPILVGWILFSLAILVLIFHEIYMWLRRDPTRVGAGRVLENGLRTPQKAADYARDRIAQTTGVLPSQVSIINIVRGRLYGWARISDRLGSFFGRFLNGEEGWEVTAQTPNGRTTLYTLIACANDVRAGSGMIPGFGFRFLAEENVTDQAQPPAPVEIPEPVPAPAQSPKSEDVRTPMLMVQGLHLSEQSDGPSFSMWTTNGIIGFEFTKGSNQFFLTVAPPYVQYNPNEEVFTFEGSDLPPGMKIPVPAKVIAAAAVGQLLQKNGDPDGSAEYSSGNSIMKA
jgi:hypothetical protein